MTQNRPPTRLLVIDDDSLVLNYFSTIISGVSDIDLIATASTAEQALSVAASTRINVALTDIHLPGVNGIILTESLCTLPHPPHVIAMTALDTQDIMLTVLSKGAKAYVSKSAHPSYLIETIRHVASGYPIVISRTEKKATLDKPVLTDSSRRVLTLLCDGRSNAEIASELFLSESAVKKRISSLLNACHARTRLELATKALRGGWVE